MNFTPHKRRRTPSVIIVSLIDVLLVVLIFLMVSSTFKQDLPALKLALPQSKIAKTGSTDNKDFQVLVTTNFPYFFVGEKPVTLDQLQREIEAAVKRNPQVSLRIKADKQSPFGEVIRVIDAGKLANVASINAVTEKTSK
jgi:biopolymer transport protein ExbD